MGLRAQARRVPLPALDQRVRRRAARQPARQAARPLLPGGRRGRAPPATGARPRRRARHRRRRRRGLRRAAAAPAVLLPGAHRAAGRQRRPRLWSPSMSCTTTATTCDPRCTTSAAGSSRTCCSEAPRGVGLMPMTTDPRAAGAWLRDQPPGIEGVVAKRRDQRYRPGARSWQKLRARDTAEAVIGGVFGTLEHPEALVLGRYRGGRLRVVGRTSPLPLAARAELRRSAATPVHRAPLAATAALQPLRTDPGSRDRVHPGRAGAGGRGRDRHRLRAGPMAPRHQVPAPTTGPRPQRRGGRLGVMRPEPPRVVP